MGEKKNDKERLREKQWLQQREQWKLNYNIQIYSISATEKNPDILSFHLM